MDETRASIFLSPSSLGDKMHIQKIFAEGIATLAVLLTVVISFSRQADKDVESVYEQPYHPGRNAFLCIHLSLWP